MPYEVRNVKTFMGNDCPGFNATLYRDGVKIALVVDDGSGGMMSFEWLDCQAPKVEIPWWNYKNEPCMILCTPEEAKLHEFIRGKTFDGLSGPEQMDIEMFASGLVDKFENAKRFKRLCKTNTLFRVNGDKDGEWRTIKGPFTKRIKDFIVKIYGVKVEVILNETFGQVAS